MDILKNLTRTAASVLQPAARQIGKTNNFGKAPGPKGDKVSLSSEARDPLSQGVNHLLQGLNDTFGGGKGGLDLDLAGMGKALNPNLSEDQERDLNNLSGGIKAVSNGSFTDMLKPGDPRKAGQLPGQADQALARKNAGTALENIDWSKDTVALWVPGTGQKGVDKKFKNSVGNDASTVAVDYPANLDMIGGVSTGMETTRMIVEEANRRGKKVVLGGHSQGAWVAGEVMANQNTRSKIDKAVLYGHPTQANAQFHNDPKVRVVNHQDDPYTQKTIDLQQIASYLLGARRPDGSDQHGYNYGDQIPWLLS